MSEWQENVRVFVLPPIEEWLEDGELEGYEVSADDYREVVDGDTVDGYVGEMVRTLDEFEQLEATGEIDISTVVWPYVAPYDEYVFPEGGVLEGAIETAGEFYILVLPGLTAYSGSPGAVVVLEDGTRAIVLDPYYMDEGIVLLRNGELSHVSMPRILADELTHVADPSIGEPVQLRHVGYMNNAQERNSMRVSNLYATLYGEPERVLRHDGCYVEGAVIYNDQDRFDRIEFESEASDIVVLDLDPVMSEIGVLQVPEALVVTPEERDTLGQCSLLR